MSLVAVIVIVLILGVIATFAPLDPGFKRLLYFIAAGVVVLWLVLLLLGAVDVGGWGHRSTTVTVP